MSNTNLSQLYHVLDAAFRSGSESHENIALALGRMPTDYGEVASECQGLATRIGQSRTDVVNDLKEKSANLAARGEQFEAVARALEQDAPELAPEFVPGLRAAKLATATTVELLNVKVHAADEALAAAAKALEAAGKAMTGHAETIFKPATDSQPKVDDLLDKLAGKREEVAQALDRQRAAES